MLTPKKHSDSWREALKFINRCPVCNTVYPPEAAKLLATTDTAHFIHIACTDCASFFMAMILMLGQGISSVGMVTDMSFEDLKKIHRLDPITIDETIAGFEQIHHKDFINSFI